MHAVEILRDERLSPLFLAAAEAVEEAIYHSLFAARTMTGWQGHRVEALPQEKTRKILEKYHRFIPRKAADKAERE